MRGARLRNLALWRALTLLGAFLALAPRASATPTDATGRAADRATASFHYGRGLYPATYTLGLEYPVSELRSAAVDWELSPASGVIAPRASYHMQLTAPRLITAAATLGITTTFVYRGTLDVGIGPRVGLGVSLGPDWLRLDLGGQGALEIFVTELGPRAPVRAVSTLRARLFDFVAGVSVRAGYDYELDHFTLPRFEALAFVGTSAFDER